MPDEIQVSVVANTNAADKSLQTSADKYESALTKAIHNGMAKGSASFKFNEGAFTRPLGSIRGSLGEFTKSMEAANARVVAFGASAGSFYLLQKALRETVTATIEVDKSLRSINTILGTSASSLEKFGGSLFSIARETGRSFSDVASAAEELARQGLGAEQTLQRTKDAMILARTSGLQVVSAVEAITAALNSFNATGLTSNQLINKLVAVDASFAVSSADLAEAVKRVGSSASDAGVGLDELVAAVTAAQQTTARGGAVIGNSFKTIFTRVQRPQVVEALENLGVETRKSNGELLGAIEILGNLSRSYDTLNQAQRSQVAELVGGVYQINILKATLRDLGREYSVYSNALEISQGATNEATKRNEELNQSLASTINRAAANLTKFGAEFGKTSIEPVLRKILDLFNQITESTAAGFDTSALKVIGEFFSGPGLALAFKAVQGITVQFVKFLADAVISVTKLGTAQENVNLLTQQYITLLQRNPEILQKVISGETSILELQRVINTELTEEIAKREIIANFARQAAISSAAAGFKVDTSSGSSQGKVVRAKAGGYIPNMVERMGAMAGGYMPGDVRSMMIPGEGNVFYNSAERVRRFPGMSGPAIMPPEESPAGKGYRKEFENKHGFNPYKANGLIPGGLKGAALVAGASVGASVVGQGVGGKAGEVISETGNILTTTLFLMLTSTKKWNQAIIGTLGGLYAVSSVFKTITRTGDTTKEALENAKDNFQKTSDGLNVYQKTLSDLNSAYMDSKSSTKAIVALQQNLAESLQSLPDDIRKQVLGITSADQLSDLSIKIRNEQTKRLKQLEVANSIENRLNGMMVGRRGSIYDIGQRSESKTARLQAVASNIFSGLDRGRVISEIQKGGSPFAGNIGTAVSRLGGGQEISAAVSQISGESLADLRKELQRLGNESERNQRIFSVTADLRTRENQAIERYNQASKVAEQRIVSARQNLTSVGGFQGTFNTQGRANRADLLLQTAKGGLSAGRSLMSEQLAGGVEFGLENLGTNQNFINAARRIYDSAAEQISRVFNKSTETAAGGVNAPRITGAQAQFATLLGKPNTLGQLGEGSLGILRNVSREAEGGDIRDILSDSNKELIKLVQETQQNHRVNELQYRVSQEQLNIQRSSKLGGGIEALLDPSKRTSGIGASIGMLRGGMKGKGAIELAQQLTTFGGVSSDNPDIRRLRNIAIEEQKKVISSNLSDTARQLDRAGFGQAAKEIRGSTSGKGLDEAAKTAILGAIPAGRKEDLPTAIQALLNAANELSKAQAGGLGAGRVQEMSSAFRDALDNSMVGKALQSLTAAQIGYQVAQALLKTKQEASAAKIKEAVESVRAFGNIPDMERGLAAAGGYVAGGIRSMGGLTYNSAESVVNVPGFSEPFINPPMGSRAGMLHRKKAMSMTGIDPYNAAFGYVPNYAVETGIYLDKSSGRYKWKGSNQFASTKAVREIIGSSPITKGFQTVEEYLKHTGGKPIEAIPMGEAGKARLTPGAGQLQKRPIIYSPASMIGPPLPTTMQKIASSKVGKFAGGFVKSLFGAEGLAMAGTGVLSRFAGAASASVGGRRNIYGTVGQSYLEDEIGTMGQSKSDYLRFIDPSESLRSLFLSGLSGDISGQGAEIALMEQKLRLSQRRKQARIAGRVAPVSPEQIERLRFANRISGVADTLAAIKGARGAGGLDYIGRLRSNINVASDPYMKNLLQRELLNEVTEYNTGLITSKYGITDPEQIRRWKLRIGNQLQEAQERKAALGNAVNRESSALRERGIANPSAFMYIDSSPRIKDNEEGLGVFNLLDEPNGPEFAAGGKIPNFATPGNNPAFTDLIYKISQLMEKIDRLPAEIKESLKNNNSGGTKNTSDINLGVTISGNVDASGSAKEAAVEMANAIMPQLRREIDAIAGAVGASAKTAVAGVRGAA